MSNIARLELLALAISHPESHKRTNQLVDKTMLRQVGLISAGCQPWNSNMVAGTGQRFAYCSTMAVYIYEFDSQFGEYKLTSINADHSKTITSISWNGSNPDLIATVSSDLRVLVWDVVKHKVIAQLPKLKKVPNCIDWVAGHHDSPMLSYIYAGGQLETWSISTSTVCTNKGIPYFNSEVTVFRWHHTKQKTIAFGHLDGSISLFVQDEHKMCKNVMRFTDDGRFEDTNKVLALSWDPLSNDYLLVANKSTGIRLVDTTSCSTITTFSLPSKAVTTCTFSWIHSAPGMFLTGDSQTGIMRLWSVGQSTCLENFRLKSTGFNCLHVLDVDHEEHYREDQNMSQDLLRKNSSSLEQVQHHSVPPASVVCTFKDGGVGIYDLQRRKWRFFRDQGHIETIFDCKFKPDDPRTLATASFDGTVKVWSINDLTPKKTSVGNEGVIYSLSWAPDDLNCIACGTRQGGIFVWDFNKGKVIKRFHEHGQKAVFCVSWNQRDSHRLASCSNDCTCIVRRLDGKEVKKFQHPAPVFGCDWNLFDKDVFATGCDDGIVRVWNFFEDHTMYKLTGHADKVFHVRWHPLLKSILCSGSDDNTVRVWNIDRTKTGESTPCISVLTGHTAPVRGLDWNHEIPYLLISGSWDSTIRLWDVRDDNEKCLEIVKDHGADVYGLTSHPMSPFLLASSSRDSTLRLWSLAPAVSMLFLKVIANHPVNDIISTPEKCMEIHGELKLAGIMSKKIVDQLKGTKNTESVKLRWFSELFCASPALENLWDVVCCADGSNQSSLSSFYKSNILHTKHLTKYKASEAQELELTSGNRPAAGNRQQELLMKKASAIYLKLGNLRKYCELLKQSGKWESALSLAPGVSIEYWRELANEYAEFLESCKRNECLSYQIALGKIKKAAQYLSAAGEHQDALLVAQSAREGRLPSPLYSPRSIGDEDEHNYINNKIGSESEFDELISECCNKLSQKKLLDGDPYRAAAYLVANNDHSAVDCLVQTNELPLAVCVSRALQQKGTNLSEGVELIAKKLEGYSGDEEYRENLHEYAGILSPVEFLNKAEQYENQGKLVEAMRCYLLSTNRVKGLEIGLKLLCDQIRQKSWSLSSNFLDELKGVLCVPSCVLTQPSQCRNKNKLLAISAYLGALRALRQRYLPVVSPLFEHAIAMTERLELMPTDPGTESFPLKSSSIKQDLNAWKLDLLRKERSGSPKKNRAPSDEKLKKIMYRAGVVERSSNCTRICETIVAGSNLPSHSDVHISSLTNRRVKGPVFYLEDKSTLISLNEAIMWGKINEFSPTGSGERIFPF